MSQELFREANSLDALLVLGGEGADRSRSNHASELYGTVQDARNFPLYLVLAGRTSGLAKLHSGEPESVGMRNYLSSKGVPLDVMYTEEDSLDTLTNIIFSEPILSRLSAKRVGLVTDQFHMKRSLWAAVYVLGTDYNIVPLPTQRDASLSGKAMEQAIETAWRFDLRLAGVQQGDQEAFQKYVREKHPFYTKNSPFGAYKACIVAFKLLKRL